MKHCVTITIDLPMEDMHIFMVTEIYQVNSNYKIWDKGQMILILSRKESDKNNFSFGDINDTLEDLK